jgi:hypothetical protein
MKRFSVIFVVLALCLSLCACGGPSVQVEPNISVASMFVEVESNLTWRVVYHRETKVMYVISEGVENHGNFTVLLNADGTPQTWKGY